MMMNFYRNTKMISSKNCLHYGSRNVLINTGRFIIGSDGLGKSSQNNNYNLISIPQRTFVSNYQQQRNFIFDSQDRILFFGKTQNQHQQQRRYLNKFNEINENSTTITTTTTQEISKYQAYEMVHKLTDIERVSLKQALEQYESDQVKSTLEGQLAATRWRSKFIRRNQSLSTLGDVDPTGTYCAMPDDWLKNKLAEAAQSPTKDELFRLMIVNAVPFVGFGFLDNFFMIIAGDYIEHSMGIFMCISTMAAAGFGNTISDVLGLGLAHYVEMFCEFIGLRPPKLTPAQFEMKSSRRTASIGRALGITIGCLLGMCPLFFINKSKDSGGGDEGKRVAVPVIVEKSPATITG